MLFKTSKQTVHFLSLKGLTVTSLPVLLELSLYPNSAVKLESYFFPRNIIPYQKSAQLCWKHQLLCKSSL